jgi:hypothetical protein
MESNEQKIKVLTPVVTSEGWKIGIAVWGELGYKPMDRAYATEDEVRKICDDYNERHGFNRKQAWLIVTKTMFPGCTTTLEDVIKAGMKDLIQPRKVN